MITILLEKIITILEGWIQSFASHAQHVEDKLDSLDQTASDIETNTEPISDIADNTGAVVTPIQNIKSNTDSIKQSSQTSANNTTAILNNISTLSTNTGRAAAFAEDCANNTLEIKDKITTIASDTTQLRADTSELNDMSDKIYEAIKWSLSDKYIDETESGPSPMSFDTDIADDLIKLNAGIVSTQSGSGIPSYNNVRSINGYTDQNIILNGNANLISLGQTVYSGVMNVITGVLTIDRIMKVFDGSSDEIWNEYPTANGFFVSGLNDHVTENYGEGKCNMLPTSKSVGTLGVIYGINSKYIFTAQVKSEWNVSNVSDLRTFLSSNNLEIEYKLATPIEVQLTAQQIAAVKGVNTITSDTNGDIEVTYKESIKHYLDKQDN